jgi:hypothetical protein
MEQEVYGRDFANDNASFRKHLDTKTFLKNLLIGEFAEILTRIGVRICINSG